MSTQNDFFVQHAHAVERYEALSYGRHSPLGRTLDVPEEHVPPEGYIGRHRCDGHTPCLHVTIFPPGSKPEMKWVQY